MYFRNYTRYETELRLLNRRILEIADQQGKVRLGELEIQNDTSLVPDINIALKPTQVKTKEFEQLLEVVRAQGQDQFSKVAISLAPGSGKEAIHEKPE